MLELLINKGANVNYPRKSDGMSPLMGLIVDGDGEKRSFELDLFLFKTKRICMEFKKMYFLSASPKFVELLIRHGADVNHADQAGKTALHNAAHFGGFFI